MDGRLSWRARIGFNILVKLKSKKKRFFLDQEMFD
jgi:hypothetical protein